MALHADRSIPGSAGLPAPRHLSSPPMTGGPAADERAGLGTTRFPGWLVRGLPAVRTVGLGIAAFIVVAPLLALAHEALVLLVAELLGGLGNLARNGEVPRALPLDPIYTGALLLTLGGIDVLGVAVAQPVGGVAEALWPAVFEPADLVATGAWASAVVAWFVYGVNAYTPRLGEILAGWPERGIDAAVLVSEFALLGAERDRRGEAFGELWSTIGAFPDYVIGGSVYVWYTEGPEEVDREFGLVDRDDRDGRAVDDALDALGRLYREYGPPAPSGHGSDSPNFAAPSGLRLREKEPA